MLEKLNLKYVGPAPEFNVDFAPRLNVFTGDNGLGKSFLLEVAWRALTQTWINAPASPQKIKGKEPEITYQISNYELPFTSKFKWQSREWSELKEKDKPESGLIIYISIDQIFSVWDMARPFPPSKYHFTLKELWEGKDFIDENDNNKTKVLCRGLIEDWVTWYKDRNDNDNFQLLSDVIAKLSPHKDNILIKPAKPTRVATGDAREIPTLELPYGTIPITQISAGIKRILSIAYFIVWSWLEHIQESDNSNQETTNQIILLIDEVELHLHPQWQRAILPAILEVVKSLKEEIDIQILATTHSPLVLASLEPDFDESQDQLFLLDLEENNVTLKDIPFAKFGDVSGWLNSPFFGLSRPRSRQAEIAINAAIAFIQEENMDQYPITLRTKEGIDQELKKLLDDDDEMLKMWKEHCEENDL